MAIEFLKDPDVVVMDGIELHVLAVERGMGIDGGQEIKRIAGMVALQPTTVKRYLEDRPHVAIVVDGIIGSGDSPVDDVTYNKTVASTGFFSSLTYGVRLGFAKKRAANRVKSALGA